MEENIKIINNSLTLNNLLETQRYVTSSNIFINTLLDNLYIDSNGKIKLKFTFIEYGGLNDLLANTFPSAYKATIDKLEKEAIKTETKLYADNKEVKIND